MQICIHLRHTVILRDMFAIQEGQRGKQMFIIETGASCYGFELPLWTDWSIKRGHVLTNMSLIQVRSRRSCAASTATTGRTDRASTAFGWVVRDRNHSSVSWL